VYRADHDHVRFIAGQNTAGFAGDGGPAADAMLAPGDSEALTNGLAVDSEGNLFIQDGGNGRIRAIRFGAVLAPPNAAIRADVDGHTIRATVLDAEGATAPGVRVDFATPSAGASCVLSSPFAITGADGVAIVNCAPNCIEGTYLVTAHPLTATSTASVSFTNRPGPCRRRSVQH
jgi:hypothetical protein